MTPEQQRIAIAQACGWTAELWSAGGWQLYRPNRTRVADGGYGTRDAAFLRACPDYLNDLNAMREAETCEAIMKAGYHHYLECLTIACGTDRVGALVFATAAQRAEAFLRTLNLWQA